MASKISALAALTAVADGDLVPVVDISDTSMAATGTDKKVVASDLQTYVLGDIGTALPSTPANGVSMYSRSIGGRQMLTQVDQGGDLTSLQPHLARNRASRWLPAGNSGTIDTDGGPALTLTGTSTSANVATTNLHTIMKRLECLVTVAATTAVAGFRVTAAQHCRGNAAKIGGFHYVCRWGPATGVATTTNRAFVGMDATTGAPTDVQPSAALNVAGMGWDAADTNIQVMHNDGSGTCTKIDLGASFPVPTTDRTKVYELSMWCLPNGSDIKYVVTDLATDATASGTISTDMPAGATLLTPRMWMSVGGTSSVIGIALMGLYIETDY